mgnify:CR=1 FL=1
MKSSIEHFYVLVKIFNGNFSAKFLAKKYIYRFKSNMENNNISFKSKIKFVDRAVYKMMPKKNYIDFKHSCPNILKADEFFSEGIRTCTGGGLVNPNVEAEGFHIWDDMTNKKRFPLIINSLFRFVKSPKRALLVGSKELKGSDYSLEQFERFKQSLQSRIKNISYFQKHRYYNSETHYHYSMADDTWTLCSSFQQKKNGKYKTVRSLKDLLDCFEHISIAKGDRLFIGKKEILPKDCPEIFMQK